MHISEGVLSAPILISGAALATIGVALGLKQLKTHQSITLCGLLSSAFFVGSLIHVPIGIGNAHLLLSGLLGVLLGWASFPAIFMALLLQAILFQYGGITILGVNTFTMGFAAVISWYIFKGMYLLCTYKKGLFIAAFCGGFSGVFLSTLFTSLALAFTDEGFKVVATALFIAHIPVMFIEAIITAFTVSYLQRFQPGMLSLSIPHPKENLCLHQQSN